MNTLSRSVLLLLGDMAVRATVLLALAAIIAILSRRASASFRHWVWALGLGCLFFLPALTLALPRWHVAVPAPATLPQPVAPALPTKPLPAVPPVTPTDIAPSSPSSQPAPPAVEADHFATAEAAVPAPSPPFPWAIGVLLLWVLGAVLTLAQLIQGLVSVRQIGRQSVPVNDGPAAEALAEAKASMRIARPVMLRLASASSRVTVPLTYGALRPVIVLPASASDWPSARLRAALLHEMAHVRRGDWLLHLMAHFIRALYWFHPLVWLSARQMRAESETACDDLVLAAGMPAPDYARHLLDVALSARRSSQIGTGAVAMAQSPKVEGRLRAVLASGSNRRPLTKRLMLGGCAAALVLAVPLAALRLGAQTQPVLVDHLQLPENFTLRYAATITDLRTPAMMAYYYGQMRREYQGQLKKNPHFQPVPDEFYQSFAEYRKRALVPRHLILTVSAGSGHLLYTTEEKGYPYTLVFNGQSTQPIGGGHLGVVHPGLSFGEWSYCPLPGMSLPYVPLFKEMTESASYGKQQTWKGKCLQLNEEGASNSMYYEPGTIHAIHDDDAWKVTDVDATTQTQQFTEHQQFQGLWLPSRMRLTKYDLAAPIKPLIKPLPHLRSEQAIDDWFRPRRVPSETWDYHLLSTSSIAIDPGTLVKTHRSRGDTAATHIALGQKLQQEGQPRDGIPEFRKAVQIDPNNAQAQYYLASGLYSFRWQRKGNEIDSRDTPPTLLAEAILHLRKAVALQPGNADWQSALGTYLENQGHYAEAIRFYKQALHLRGPAATGTWNPLHQVSTDGSMSAGRIANEQWSLADVLLQTGQYHEATIHYQEALRFNPRAVWILLGYGDALNGQGQRAEAHVVWKKVIAQDKIGGNPSYYGRQAQERLAKYP